MTAPVQITLLTQTSCAMCELAKEILSRLGNEYPLSVTEVDLHTDEGRTTCRRGGCAVRPRRARRRAAVFLWAPVGT